MQPSTVVTPVRGRSLALHASSSEGVRVMHVEGAEAATSSSSSLNASLEEGDQEEDENARSSEENDMSRRIRQLWNYVLQMNARPQGDEGLQRSVGTTTAATTTTTQPLHDNGHSNAGSSISTPLPRPETPLDVSAGSEQGNMHVPAWSVAIGPSQAAEEDSARVPDELDQQPEGVHVDGIGMRESSSSSSGVSNGHQQQQHGWPQNSGVEGVGLIVYIYRRHDDAGSPGSGTSHSGGMRADASGQGHGQSNDEDEMEPSSPPSASAHLVGEEDNLDVGALCPPGESDEDSELGCAWNIETLDFELQRMEDDSGFYELSEEQVVFVWMLSLYSFYVFVFGSSVALQ
jgi:hypothetical protein